MKYLFHENKVPQDGSMNLQNNREVSIQYYYYYYLQIYSSPSSFTYFFSYLNNVKVDISDYELHIDLNDLQ